MSSQFPITQDSEGKSISNRHWIRFASVNLGNHADLFAWLFVLIGFLWRLWLAHATFLNTDEAWHFSVANQTSLGAAYKASLTLAHPPLLVFVLYFWRPLGTSDLMLRLPGVLAGSLFCWVFYKWLLKIVGHAAAWVGLIFGCLLPPMIALSAELRQYGLMLLFAVSAAYFLERALAENSAGAMFASFGCLYLAMLSHYSAFLFAGGLGVYALVRLISSKLGRIIPAVWAAGQIVGVAAAVVLYKTHVAKLSSVYPVAQPLERFGDFYLSDWYFHPGRDNLVRFLCRGTFGVFRFIFGQTGVGQIAALLFFAGVLWIAISKRKRQTGISGGSLVILLMSPFIINWIAVVAGLYPYGRTRQCMFLAVFALAGTGVALSRIANDAFGPAAALALVMVIVCHAFGTLQGRDMLPVSEQRHEYMDEAIQLIRSEVRAGDVILTDKATSFQLRDYLCRKNPVADVTAWDGFDVFRCEGFVVLSTSSSDGALTASAVERKLLMARGFPNSTGGVWVVQGGWASGLGEELQKSEVFKGMEVHRFGRYLEILKMPGGCSIPAVCIEAAH